MYTLLENRLWLHNIVSSLHGFVCMCLLMGLCAGVRILPQPWAPKIGISYWYHIMLVKEYLVVQIYWYHIVMSNVSCILMSRLYCKWSLETMDEDQQNWKEMASTDKD